jgi:CBS-domain-containing membrane protein
MKYEAFVSDIMESDVKIVQLDDPIKKAAEIMASHRIGSVLVMGEKHLKGIVTAEDIVYKHVAAGQGAKASDIMTRDPITIRPDAHMDSAARLMAEKRIKKLPVVDASGKVVGIVTASDIVRVEPALHETLMELLKITSPGAPEPPRGAQMFQCEMCNNYSDDVEEMDGVWICPNCEEMKAGPKGEQGV